MIKLTGAVPDNKNQPTDKRIEFEIHEDLVEMIIDGKYYFKSDSEVYYSMLYIDNTTYVDIRKAEPAFGKGFGSL